MKIDWLLSKKEFCLEADVLLSAFDVFNLFIQLISFFGPGATDEDNVTHIIGYKLADCMSLEDFMQSTYKWYFHFNDGILRFKNSDDMFYFKLLVI